MVTSYVLLLWYEGGCLGEMKRERMALGQKVGKERLRSLSSFNDK